MASDQPFYQPFKGERVDIVAALPEGNLWRVQAEAVCPSPVRLVLAGILRLKHSLCDKTSIQALQHEHPLAPLRVSMLALKHLPHQHIVQARSVVLHRIAARIRILQVAVQVLNDVQHLVAWDDEGPEVLIQQGVPSPKMPQTLTEVFEVAIGEVWKIRHRDCHSGTISLPANFVWCGPIFAKHDRVLDLHTAQGREVERRF
mmetsp:Transcript_82702/g.267776  ORF Transcript_82702/g.267776 Transcript_82702/m.267776 type:complete len:202 (+) Transcript_82702:362-967(+)